MPTDLSIARAASLKPLDEVAASMGIESRFLEPYGEGVAKIKLDAIDQLADRPKAKYVVVTAITPTPLGEGKTTTTVGSSSLRSVGVSMPRLSTSAVQAIAPWVSPSGGGSPR